jgi:hypothetical protein
LGKVLEKVLDLVLDLEWVKELVKELVKVLVNGWERQWVLLLVDWLGQVWVMESVKELDLELVTV